jgi:hypothetical protein
MTLPRHYLTVSQGNLNNHHLYLAKILELFPEDVLGGSDAGQAAPGCVRIYCDDEVIETDIDRTKKIFRKRSWLGRFFNRHRIQPGAHVLLERIEPYVYRLRSTAFADRVHHRIGIGCKDSPPAGAVGTEEENAEDETLSGTWTTTNDPRPARPVGASAWVR